MNRPVATTFGSLAIALVAFGFAMPPDERPTERVADCSSGGCHADVTKFQFLHAPVAVDACEVCHVYDDPTQHTFKLIEQHGGEPICSFCHIGKSTFGRDDNWVGLHVHEPVAEGECISCHNPHGSNLRKLIDADTVGSLCTSCHDSVVGQAHMHPPAEGRDCLSCHEPHAGPYEKLLHQTGRELCLDCHADVLPASAVGYQQSRRGGQSAIGHMAVMDLQVGAQIVLWTATLVAQNVDLKTQNAAIIHEPLLGECSDCHNPHGSPYPKMLQKDTQTLCISCHEDVGQKIGEADVHHSAVLDDRACLNCHSPHHSEHISLLNDQPIALCASCHEDSHQRPDGTMIAGMSELFRGAHLHGPINDGDCSGCHDVHGGKRQSLLTAHYSDELYQSFSEENYALCFTCHDSDLATEKHTTTATNFREGDRNLHYVHVTGPDEAGRSCRFCHDTHAGTTSRMMRARVPYGQWELPIEFEPTDTGGTCGAGCHRERSYTRDPRETSE